MTERAQDHGYDPTRALEALANDGAPPSRLDILRAAQDGHRLRVRRRTIRTLSSVTAAGALAVVALVVPAHFGGPGTGAATAPTPSRAPVCPPMAGSTPNAPGDYAVEAPAHFGWFPSDLFDEMDEVIQNPQFGAASGAEYAAGFGEGSAATPQIKFTIGADAQPVATSGAGHSLTLPGPAIDGDASHWTTSDKDSIVSGGAAELTWTTPQGCLADLRSTGIDAATAGTVLPRIADSLVVQNTLTPMPFQITGMPRPALMAAGAVDVEQAVPGSKGGVSDYSMVVGFLGRNANITADVIAYPVASFPGVPSSGESSACKASKGLEICVETPAAMADGISAALPGGIEALLAHVVSLGTNPADWSPQVVKGTH